MATGGFGESEAHYRRGDPGRTFVNDPNDGDRVLSHRQPWQALLEQRVGGELPERKGPFPVEQLVFFSYSTVQYNYTLLYVSLTWIKFSSMSFSYSFCSQLLPFLLPDLPRKQWPRWRGADRVRSTSVWPLPPHPPTGLDQRHRPAYGGPGMQHSGGKLRPLTEPTDSI